MTTETEKTRKLTLEEYVRFFQGRDQQSFSSVQLNQIFTMHAFVQPRSVKVMVEALRWIDLMLPARSTVRDPRTYPCAALSLDEVRDDIAALGWKECPIGSLAAALGSSAPPVEESTVRDDIAAVGWQECPIDSEAVEESTVLISFGPPTDVIALSDATAGAGKKRKRPRRSRFPPLANLPTWHSSASVGPIPPPHDDDRSNEIGKRSSSMMKLHIIYRLQGIIEEAP